jgi:hypothetical protein
MSTDALKTIPDIITAASRTTLGILALLILVVAFLGFYLFRNERAVRYRFGVFLLTFVGTAAFGLAALITQHNDAVRAESQLLPALKLNLAFTGSESANPYRSVTTVYVQPSDKPDDPYDAHEFLRTDIRPIPGPGGVILEFRKLAVGDRVYVELQDQDRKWRSFPMTMLEANLQMFPVEP